MYRVTSWHSDKNLSRYFLYEKEEKKKYQNRCVIIDTPFSGPSKWRIGETLSWDKCHNNSIFTEVPTQATADST